MILVSPISGLGRSSERGEPRLHRGARQVDHQPMERVGGGERVGRGARRRRDGRGRRARPPLGRRRRQAARQHDARRG